MEELDLTDGQVEELTNAEEIRAVTGKGKSISVKQFDGQVNQEDLVERFKKARDEGIGSIVGRNGSCNAGKAVSITPYDTYERTRNELNEYKRLTRYIPKKLLVFLDKIIRIFNIDGMGKLNH